MLGEKRFPSFDSSENSRKQHDFRLSKCRKLDGGNDIVFQESHRSLESETTRVPEKFRARLEICSPDSFSVTPVPVNGFRFPEKEDCLGQLNEILSEVRVVVIYIYIYIFFGFSDFCRFSN